MNSYTSIFRQYTTSENIPFMMLNRRVVFPDDRSLPIYSKKLITSDTPWTILSYQIYGKIEYWWILCALNDNNMYYAREGSLITFVKPEYISTIENSLK